MRPWAPDRLWGVRCDPGHPGSASRGKLGIDVDAAAKQDDAAEDRREQGAAAGRRGAARSSLVHQVGVSGRFAMDVIAVGREEGFWE